MGIGSELYSAASVYGRVRSIIMALVAVIVMIIMVAIGTTIINSHYTARAQGTITAVQSQSSSKDQNGHVTYSATVTARYTYAGKSYTVANIGVLGSGQFSVGQTVELDIDPAHPGEPRYGVVPKPVGWALIAIGVGIAAAAAANAYFAVEYKSYAAMTGTLDMASDVKRVL